MIFFLDDWLSKGAIVQKVAIAPPQPLKFVVDGVLLGVDVSDQTAFRPLGSSHVSTAVVEVAIKAEHIDINQSTGQQSTASDIDQQTSIHIWRPANDQLDDLP